MESSKKIQPEKIICYLCLIALFLIIFIIMESCVLDFDAGMNFMVTKYLAINGDYATYYDEYVLFDHAIQTGGIVIALTTLLNLFAGINTVHMQIVTTLFLCLLIGTLYQYIKNQANSYFSLVVIVVIATSPWVIRTAVTGYGEIPMGFLMIAAVLLFKKVLDNKNFSGFFCIGLILGIGYLTKTVFLIILPSFIFWVTIDYLINKRRLVKYYLALIIGVFTSNYYIRNL